MEFKVGDRVTLKGGDWNDTHTEGLETGDVVTIGEIDEDGSFRFVGFEKDGWWDVEMYGWGVELNTDTPLEHFAKQNASTFEQSVRRHTDRIASVLVEKNKSYGDSALNPVRIFSKADRMEQLYIRLDDKISRVKSGHEYPGDDTIQDIIGYCVLILIARESA